MNRKRDIAYIALALIAVVGTGAYLGVTSVQGGGKAEIRDSSIAIGGDEGTPCDQPAFCRVEHDENGETTVYVCNEHESPSIGIQIDPNWEPNDLLFDMSFYDYDVSSSLTICTESGGELVLFFGGDKLEITGDADMNEAARTFFHEILKPLVDAYITPQNKKRDPSQPPLIEIHEQGGKKGIFLDINVGGELYLELIDCNSIEAARIVEEAVSSFAELAETIRDVSQKLAGVKE